VAAEQANISQGRSISGIWIIPLLALALGAYMIVHTWMTEGPEIEIAFKSASGLEQGKTKVKYRNVEMGLVQSVRLNDDLDGVIATIKMEHQAIPLLVKDTQFWVVTARVGLGNISGLDTLLSGAYIQIEPGERDVGERHFVALERPPQTPAGAPGLRLKLTSENTSSVGVGDGVLYNGFRVGRIESMVFDPNDRLAHYELFIDAPYHTLVDSQSRFWDASGISLSAGADGIKLDTGSVDTILLGGVSFGLPPGISKGEPVAGDTEFKLYDSYDDILKNPYRYGLYYTTSFSQSIKGLQSGAPVEYRGLPIGRVERVMLKEGLQNSIKTGTEGSGTAIPVLIYLEPGRIGLPDQPQSVEYLKKSIEKGVTLGMRASLETGNLLSGSKLISINYFKDVEPASVGELLDYTFIPSIETGLGQIEQKLNAVLDKINKLPLEDTLSEANTAIASLNAALASLNLVLESESTQELPEQLDKTLQDLQGTLKGFSPDSEVYQSIQSSLLRLNRTLGNMESLTRTLSGQPNAAILPSDPVPDPIPEVSK
jgi:paraquat-inducible protein B